jgi:hypothetical protein
MARLARRILNGTAMSADLQFEAAERGGRGKPKRRA